MFRCGMICTCCYYIIPKCIFFPLCPTNFCPFGKMQNAALAPEAEIFLYMQHSDNPGTFSYCQEPQRMRTLQNLHGSKWARLSTFAQGTFSILLPQGPHLAGSPVRQCQLLDPLSQPPRLSKLQTNHKNTD